MIPTANPPRPSQTHYPAEALLTHVPQYNCPACDGAIPGVCVLPGRMSGTQITTRRVVAACPHCDRCWAIDAVLMAGVWQPLGDSEEVTGGTEHVESLRTAVAYARGEIHELPRDGGSHERQIERPVERSIERPAVGQAGPAGQPSREDAEYALHVRHARERAVAAGAVEEPFEDPFDEAFFGGHARGGC